MSDYIRRREDIVETMEEKIDDSIRTATYYAPNYTVLPTRQCLICGTLENYTASMTAVDTSLPWLCDRCRGTLLKLIVDANAFNALNALEQEDKEGKEEVTDRNVGKWLHKKITADFHAIGQCSVCKEIRRIDNFCPNCGADMRCREET